MNRGQTQDAIWTGQSLGVLLSCEECCRRKVKCDKLSPCSSCVQIGLTCHAVRRARLPRGRAMLARGKTSRPHSELVDRVTKLEQLLEQLRAENDATSTPNRLSPVVSPGSNKEWNMVTDVASVLAGQYRNERSAEDISLPRQRRPSQTYIGNSFWEDIMQQVSGGSYFASRT